MIESKIPEDLRKYKTKILGPFTFRQIIVLGITIIVDLILLTFLKGHMNTDTFIYVYMVVDIPILAFMFEIQGLPMEKFISNIFVKNFIYPAKRKQIGAKIVSETDTRTKKEIKARNKQLQVLYKQRPNMKPYK